MLARHATGSKDNLGTPSHLKRYLNFAKEGIPGANVLKLFGPDGFFQFFNKLERFVAAKYF
jgi:hypothetical protein